MIQQGSVSDRQAAVYAIVATAAATGQPSILLDGHEFGDFKQVWVARKRRSSFLLVLAPPSRIRTPRWFIAKAGLVKLKQGHAPEQHGMFRPLFPPIEAGGFV